MTELQKDKVRVTVKEWGEKAAELEILPILMIGLTDPDRGVQLWGKENFPTNDHLKGLLLKIYMSL